MSLYNKHILYGKAWQEDRGYGLFHPCSTAILKPGSIGWFNEVGEWNEIDVPPGYSKLVQSKPDVVDTTKLGPLCSTSVQQTAVDMHADMYLPLKIRFKM